MKMAVQNQAGTEGHRNTSQRETHGSRFSQPSDYNEVFAPFPSQRTFRRASIVRHVDIQTAFKYLKKPLHVLATGVPCRLREDDLPIGEQSTLDPMILPNFWILIPS